MGSDGDTRWRSRGRPAWLGVSSVFLLDLAGSPGGTIRKKLVKDATPTLHLFGGPATEDDGDDTPGSGATGPRSPAPKIETVAPARESTI